MRIGLIGLGAVMALTACGGGEGGEQKGAEVPTANAAQDAAPNDNMQARVKALPEGERNAMLIRAIRDAQLACQHVSSSSELNSGSPQLAYTATCDSGEVYAVSIQNDGSAVVQPAPAGAGQ